MSTQRDRARRYVQQYLAEHPCAECGEANIRVLTFHHRPGEIKVGNVSDLVVRGWSIRSIGIEIAKCDVLCRNCHHLRHLAKQRT